MPKYKIAYNWDGRVLAEQDQANVEVAWLENGDLSMAIDAPFANDPKPCSASASCWELWKFEVVEFFLVGQGKPAPYIEIEISPWGKYLVLRLLGARNLKDQHLPLDIISVQRNTTRWTAKAVISHTLLPEGELKVNAFRLSGQEPDRRYHVMTVMATACPDFHLIEQFETILKRLY